MSQAVNEVMYGKIGRLKDTYRYSAQPVIARENVAEHSFWTAMIAITIAYEIERSVVPQVALKALLHDIEECMTGDLVREMKYATDEFRDAVKKVERMFISSLLEDLGEPGAEMFIVWDSAKNNTLTGQIVGLADLLSVVSFCTKEHELGNTNLEEIRKNCSELVVQKYGIGPLSDIAIASINESYKRWPIPNARP